MSRSGQATRSIDLAALPKLPTGWEWSAASDICEVVASGSTPKADKMYRDDGEVPFIKVYNLTHRGVLDFSVKPTFIDRETHQGHLARSRALPGDVLINIVGPPLGKVSVVPDDYPEWNMNQAVVLFRPKPGISNRYLAFALLSEAIMRRVTRLAKATAGQFNIGVNMCRQLLPIPVAPESEQRRIVAKIEELFSDLDAGVAALERAKANLKRYRAAVLKAAVEGRLTEQWRAENPPREPAARLLQRILIERRKKWEQDQLAKYAAKGKKPPVNWKSKYKEPVGPDTSNLPQLPEGWCWAAVGHLFLIDSGEAFKKRDYSEDGLRLFQIANVGFGRTLWEQQNFLPLSFGKTHADLLLVPGDICMALNRPILRNSLKVAKLGEADMPAILYQRVARLTPVLRELGEYCFRYFLSSRMVDEVRMRLQGTDQPYLNTSLLPEIPVPIPPRKEQQRILGTLEEELSVIDATNEQIEQSLRRSPRLRQSILKRAFEGRLVPQDPPDECAERLLERIRQERQDDTNRKTPKGRPRKGRKSKSDRQRTLF